MRKLNWPQHVSRFEHDGRDASGAPIGAWLHPQKCSVSSVASVMTITAMPIANARMNSDDQPVLGESDAAEANGTHNNNNT